MTGHLDVYLSHNSRDRSVAEQIGKWLGGRGLSVLRDGWKLHPRFPWQKGLPTGPPASRVLAVLLGPEGLVSWHEPEIKAFIGCSEREQIRVIPVLLPNCPDSPQLAYFLKEFSWVDLRGGLTEDGLARLFDELNDKKLHRLEPVDALSSGKAGEPGRENGAEGRSGDDSATRFSKYKARRVRRNWGVALSILGVVGTFGAWFCPDLFGPSSPPMNKELQTLAKHLAAEQAKHRLKTTINIEPKIDIHPLASLGQGRWAYRCTV